MQWSIHYLRSLDINTNLPENISIHDFLLEKATLDRECIDSDDDILSRVNFLTYVEEKALNCLAEAVVVMARDETKTIVEALEAAKTGLEKYFIQ